MDLRLSSCWVYDVRQALLLGDLRGCLLTRLISYVKNQVELGESGAHDRFTVHGIESVKREASIS